MGQFESRPESPEEWAGLPSEPRDRRDETDLEGDAATAEALALGLGAQYTSIVIPTAPVLADGERPAPTDPDAD